MTRTINNLVLAASLLAVSSFSLQAQQWLGSATSTGNIYRSGNVGINVTSPAARLHVNGTVRLQNLGANNTATNILVLDGTNNVRVRNLSTAPLPGDNLGNHIAAMPLNMSCFDINNINSANFCGGGNVFGDGLGGLVLGGSGVNVPSLIPNTAVGVDANGYLTSVPVGGGDNLGNHIATMDLQMQCNNIRNVNAISFCGSPATATGFPIISTTPGCPGDLNVNATLTVGGPFSNCMWPGPAAIIPGSAPWVTGVVGTVLFANGDVGGGMYFTFSDKRLKKDIAPLQNALSKVKALNPVSYEYDNTLLKDTKFSEGKTNGFLAQELLEIVPEAVRQHESGTLMVNYDAVIPVLTEAIQEQQVLIESKDEAIVELNNQVSSVKEELENLKNLLQAMCENGCSAFNKTSGNNNNDLQGAVLEQNAPNPFNQNTQIRYFLPETVNTAQLFIYDMSGKQLKAMDITSRGAGSSIIEANEFSAGLYIYTLVADGIEVASKRMVLSR